jgi:PIN domain nuclease of toxin-antitoxin system
MSLLLDTHIALWAVVDDPRLSPAAKRRLRASRGGVWVSAASIWEIAIKFALQRRSDPLPFSGAEAIGHFCDAGFRLLDIRPEHAAAVASLPDLHADPFDRLLIAQARSEALVLLTTDEQIAAYGHGVMKV